MTIKYLNKITSSDIWTEQPFAKGQAWVDLTTFEKIPGYRALARRWGWHHNEVVRFLRQLQSAGHIGIKDRNVTLIDLIPKKKSTEAPELWRTDFEIYKSELREEVYKLLDDRDFISTQSRLNPGINIPKSLEKACVNFWATERGWERKKKSKTKKIDWKSTLVTAISFSSNQVRKQS